MDSTADAIFEYRDAVVHESGSYFADRVYDLNGSNSAAQGIADPRAGRAIDDSKSVFAGNSDQPVVADQAIFHEFAKRPALNLQSDLELARVTPPGEPFINETETNGEVSLGEFLCDPALDKLESMADSLFESGREESREPLTLDRVFSRLETELAMGMVNSGRKLASR